MRWFSDRHRRERTAAERIYAASVAAARRPQLYLAFGVPDTLQGRFEMVALHLFPIMHRLMHDPGDDPELARLVSESFVADMDAGFREMGVGDLSVPKRMNALYRSFAGRMSAYKKGIEEGDEALLEAIARNVFPDGSADAHALALKAHLAATIAAVRAADLEAIRRGDLPFPEPSL